MITTTAKTPAETVTISFDFTKLAQAISAPVVTLAAHAGRADASPIGMLVGDPIIDGLLVLQQVTGVQVGTTYAITCRIDDSDGDVYELTGLLPVVEWM